MPLSKVSYPYPSDTLLVSNLLTTGTTVFSQVSKFAGQINENELGNGLYAGLGPLDNTPRLMFVPPGATTTAGNWQIDAQAAGSFRWFTPGITQMVLNDGRLSLGTTPIAATLFALNRSADRVGIIVRGAVGQTSSLQEWQDSAGSVQSAVASDGTFSIKQIRNIGGSVNRAVFSDLSSSLIVNAANTNYIGLQVRRFNDSQTSDLQQWTNSAGGTVYTRIDKDGNIGIATVPLADLHIGGVGTVSDFRMGNSVNNTVLNMFTSSNDVVIHNATATGTLQLGTNSIERMRIDSGGTTTFYGDLVVNGTTTTINSATLTVDDKNIEIGAVVVGTVSATGTVGSITGTGPWTATITNMSDTADLVVGSAISATTGTGSLGSGGNYVVASILSNTSITYTATGGTTPVAGTITTIITTGATNATANGGGIILKGATDKTILWDSANTNWTSSEHFNLVTGKVFKINNTQVLSATVLGSTVTSSSLTSFGTSPILTTPTVDTINVSGTAIAAALWNTTLTTGSISMGGALTTGGVNIATGTAFNGTVAIATGAGTVNKNINIGTGSTSGTTSIVIGSASGATSGITLNGTASISSTLTTGTVVINRSDASIEGGEIQLRRAVDNAVGFTVDVYGNNTSPDFRIFNSAGTQVLNFSTAGLLTVPSGLTVTSGTLSINAASPTIASTNASAASIFTSTVTGVTIGSSTIRTTAFPADGTTSTASASSGYMGMPQVQVTSGGRTLAATDAGKHIYMTTTSGQTLTIPANGTVAFPVGTTIVVVNANTISTSIAITTDTLRLANSTSTGTRTLASNGMCTLLKIASTEWIASGNGLT